MTMNDVEYCPVCSLPPEYCINGSSFEKCKVWLVVHRPELYPALLEDGREVNGKLMVVEDLVKLAQVSIEEKPEAEDKMSKATEVHIAVTRVKGKKMATTVSGLAKFGLTPKKIGKEMRSKFASGVTIIKQPEGLQVQGDVALEMAAFVHSKYGVPKNVIFNVNPKSGAKEPAVFYG